MIGNPVVPGNKWRRDQCTPKLSFSCTQAHFSKDLDIIWRNFIYVDHRLKFWYSFRQIGIYGILSDTYEEGITYAQDTM